MRKKICKLMHGDQGSGLPFSTKSFGRLTRARNADGDLPDLVAHPRGGSVRWALLASSRKTGMICIDTLPSDLRGTCGAGLHKLGRGSAEPSGRDKPDPEY